MNDYFCMNWEKFEKEVLVLKKTKKDYIRQNLIFEKDLYMKFKNVVGDGNVSKALNILMRGYLEFKKG